VVLTRADEVCTLARVTHASHTPGIGPGGTYDKPSGANLLTRSYTRPHKWPIRQAWKWVFKQPKRSVFLEEARCLNQKLREGKNPFSSCPVDLVRAIGRKGCSEKAAGTVTGCRFSQTGSNSHRTFKQRLGGSFANETCERIAAQNLLAALHIAKTCLVVP